MAEEHGPRQPSSKSVSASEASHQASDQAASVLPSTMQAPPAPSEHQSSSTPDAANQPWNGLFYGDGLAQWLMAGTGFLALLISGWAVWLVKGSLDETRKGTAAAVDASKTARDAIGADRAWLTAGGTKTLHYPNGLSIGGIPHAKGIGFAIKWTNSGRSPALRCSVVLDTAIIAKDGAIPHFSLPDAGDAWGVIGPSVSMETIPHRFGADDLDSLTSYEKIVIFYSRFQYRDTFQPDVVRTSEACFAFKCQGKQINERGQLEDAFSASPVGLQNTAI